METGSATSAKHVKWDEVPSETINPLFERQFIVGDRIMVARILLKKGCLVPMHSHRHEQVTQIVDGALQFSLDGKEVVVRTGEFLFIPPHLPHSAFALEDTWALDTFTPPREDWINKTDSYLR